MMNPLEQVLAELELDQATRSPACETSYAPNDCDWRGQE